jgi:hypothetical protein
VKVADKFPLLAKDVHRIDSDFSDDQAWIKKLTAAGFSKTAKTIWVSGQDVVLLPLTRRDAWRRTLSMLVVPRPPPSDPRGLPVLLPHRPREGAAEDHQGELPGR